MNRKTLVILGAAAAALIGAGLWAGVTKHTAGAETPAQTERKVLYWHDPMAPGFRSDKPGKSPFMDMELVPVYADEAGTNVVTVRPEVANNLGVRTIRVERGTQARRLRVDGYVQRVGGEVLVLADVFERGADWLRAGLPAEVRMDSLPGRMFAARVESAQPDIGMGSRSLHVVVRLDRSNPAIAANTLAEIVITSPTASKALTIPREALIRTGTRTAVLRALGEGRFQPVEVVAGTELGDRVEIVKGLNEGDVVVASGQFLLDSEASVRASFERMAPAGNEARP